MDEALDAVLYRLVCAGSSKYVRCVMDIDWLITVVQSWACIALALYVFSFVDPNRR